MDNIENKAVELTKEELEQVSGGNDGLKTRMVSGLKSGFLAIRSDSCYDSKNELGCLFNYEYVYSTERYDGEYVWVYAETKANAYYGKAAYSGYGWVNSNFLSM